MEKETDVIHISDRFHLHRPAVRHQWAWSVDPCRVLILLLPWLSAKDIHIDKYRDIYINKGLDVLCMKSRAGDFLWPPNSYAASGQLIKILKNQCKDYDIYLFHTISIGSYNFSVFRMLASENEDSQIVTERIYGLIYDSMVIGGGKGGIVKNIELNTTENRNSSSHAVDKMVEGISRSVTKNNILQGLISFLSKLYFAGTKSKTFDFYVKALDIVRDHPIKVPTLIFGSRDDPMCDPNTVEQLINIWKKDGNSDVQLQLWDSSAHAQHLMYHRKEYLETLNSFMAHVFGSNSLLHKTVFDKPTVKSQL